MTSKTDAGVRETTIAVPAEWLLRAVQVLHAMAIEGIGMEDCADPGDLMSDLAIEMGQAEADDLWQATVDVVRGRAA